MYVHIASYTYIICYRITVASPDYSIEKYGHYLILGLHKLYNIRIIVVVSWKLLVFIQVVIAIVGLSMMESTAQQGDCNYSCLFCECIL